MKPNYAKNYTIKNDGSITGLWDRMVEKLIVYVKARVSPDVKVNEETIFQIRGQAMIVLEKLPDYIGDGNSLSQKMAKRMKEYIDHKHAENPKNVSTETM